MNKRRILVLIIVIFLIWNLLTLFFFLSKSGQKDFMKKDYGKDIETLGDLVEELKEKAFQQQLLQEKLSKQLSDILHVKSSPSIPKGPLPTIAVLVLSCNRPFVKQIIAKIIKLRPSNNFPIIVSQDCKHQATTDAILSFGNQISYIKQPNQTDFPLGPKSRHLQGYYHISRHYKFALHHVFNVLNHRAAIVVEDDLDISDDFFEYFSSTLPLLLYDPTLWCVSAWNDNGKKDLVDDKNGSSLLYRTDFFPGLGWMLLKSLWKELEEKWPSTYWDDWMRHPLQRQDRACIRPEIPRSSTFGKIGVSKGQYFDKHLKFIKHCTQFVPFSKLDLSYLLKDNYDRDFINMVYALQPLGIDQLGARDVHRGLGGPYRMTYKSQDEFTVIAKRLAIMDDWKSDIPRMGYKGVVSVMYSGKRIYLAPPSPHPPSPSPRPL